jgi:hypothetical protein
MHGLWVAFVCHTVDEDKFIEDGMMLRSIACLTIEEEALLQGGVWHHRKNIP